MGEDYVEADKGRKFRSGGMAGCGTKRMNMGGMAMANKGYKKGGKVRGAGMCKKGVRPCKMR